MPALSDSVLKVFKGHPLKDGREFLGSAFLVGRNHLLTCKHVIENTREKDLFLLNDRAWADGGVRGVKSVKLLESCDVAVLCLDLPADHYLEIQNQDLSTGDEVELLGCDDKTGARSIQTLPTKISGNDGVHTLLLTTDHVQKGISGGPAVYRGIVAGIVQAKEDAHALIIPCARFLDLVTECVGELTACAELAIFSPGEMSELKILLDGLPVDKDMFMSLCVSVVGDSRIGDVAADASIWSCANFLSKKPHFAPDRAPLLVFLLRCSVTFAKEIGAKRQIAIQQWCASRANRLGIDAVALESAANGSTSPPDEIVLTIVVEPLDLVSKSDFFLKAWLWKDNVTQQCEVPDEPVGRSDLEKHVSELIRIQRKMLGREGSRLQLELAVPYSLFSWNLNQLQCQAGHVVELMGALHPVSFRSWERMYHYEFDWFRDQWPKRWDDARQLSQNDGNLNLCEANSLDECAQDLYNTLRNSPDTVWGFVAHFAVNSETDVNAIAGLFGAAFAAGIPLAFWTHGASTATKTLRSLISKLFVDKNRDSLPISLLELRKKEPDPWNDVTMIWDNPERLPPDIKYPLIAPR